MFSSCVLYWVFGGSVVFDLGDVGVCVPPISIFWDESSFLNHPSIVCGEGNVVVSTCSVLVAIFGVSSCVFCIAVFPAMASIFSVNI